MFLSEAVESISSTQINYINFGMYWGGGELVIVGFHQHCLPLKVSRIRGFLNVGFLGIRF